MASKLKAVDPKAAEPSKPKILIYGKPGVGKTFTSLDFPSCYFIDTEGGANRPQYTDKLVASGGVYFGPEQGSLDYATVIDQVKALATERHHYRTLVIDSISKLFNLAIAAEADRIAADGKKDEFGASKKPAVKMTQRLVSWLARLDMNAIMISHSKTDWGKDDHGNRVELGDTFDAWEKLEYELDLCLNIRKAGPSRTAHVRKSRLIGFPDGSQFPWSYAEFANRYGRDVIEKEGHTVTLASQAQLDEYAKLTSIFKLPPGQEDKWLKRANAEVMAELPQDSMQAVIDYIKKTFIQGEAA